MPTCCTAKISVESVGKIKPCTMRLIKKMDALYRGITPLKTMSKNLNPCTSVLSMNGPIKAL